MGDERMRTALNAAVLAVGLGVFSIGAALACGGGSMTTAQSVSDEVATVKSQLQTAQTDETTSER